ncbi:MAG: endonuclease MutS2 [Acholeplasmatales bacterium]|nr:endonuclease MutS2 [Acholeplasmatales bacterium]
MYDFNTLEFNKILSNLVLYAKGSYAKNQILENKLDYSYDEIKKRLEEVKAANEAIVKFGDLPYCVITNIKENIKRSSQGGILNPNELNDVVKLIDNVKDVINYQKELERLKANITPISIYFNKLSLPKTLKTNITLAISPLGDVLDNASRELFTIRRSIKSLENRLRAKLNELLDSKINMLSERLIVERNFRMCLPVKIEYKNSIDGIVHDISSSNTTCYIEPKEGFEISNQIELFKEKEKKEIESILKSLTLLVSSEAELLLDDIDNLTNLDVIYAKANMGIKHNYSIVNVNFEPKFNIKRCKHPLIDEEKCVPIDVNLGDKFNIIVITGPNTGGKTVTLKTIGLLHLMAYSGMMVPAKDDSNFGYFENILADIGDEQSIEQSLSTFSSHLTRIIKILDCLNDNTLVLLDELGSGTDPKEGSSLAIAIIDYLDKNNCKCVITTHYSELKTYAYNRRNIINASVEFNVDTLMPTYKLMLGVPGKSNAIEIAKRLGLKSEIIDRCKEEINNYNSESSELMGNLEEEIEQLRNKEREFEINNKKLNDEIEALRKEKNDIRAKTNKIIKDSQDEAKEIIKKAQEDADKLIKEIKNMSNESYKEHELINLQTKAKNLNVMEKDDEVFEDELHVGDFVFVKEYEKYGTICEIKKDKFYVNIGQFKMGFKKNELRLSAKPKEKPEKKTRLSGYNPTSHVGLSLDLRGKRVEEVDYLMDQYLDQAVLGNLTQVSIIHGFGTGAVRKRVQEYLKNHPSVKSFRYGGEGEGLNGVTIVYLK